MFGANVNYLTISMGQNGKKKKKNFEELGSS